MFDSPLCDRAFTQFPLFFSWGPVKWINQILPIVILSFIVFAGFWLFRHPRQRQKLLRSKLIYALLALAIALAFLIFSIANALFLPRDPGIPVNAIVILGRGQPLRSQRVQVATQLWQNRRAPLIFVSGIGDTPPTLQMLKDNNIPESAINGENCSLSTGENALFTAAILNPQTYPQILLVTDPPHMWRSLLEYRAQGYTVIPHPNPLPSKWRIEQKAFLAIREVIFLISSSFKLLFFPNTPPPDSQVQTLIQQAQEYGAKAIPR